jgi:hypothetical protein
MSPRAALAYLAESGAGVLSLAGDPPYSVPMSFAVDDSSGRLVFQSLSGPDSEKLEHLADGVGATLVAFEQSTPDDWVSAVVAGELVAVEWTSERAAAFASQARSVGLNVFDTEVSDLQGEWYELHPASVTGRCGPGWERANTFGETR